ncbi:hypothetical protein BV898_13385 [Hypsibius exemplaris]|uniref:Uncharacterized protein n=1 Tax=Hypsibius exemplaris TaxID=2072580 RepID=A0A1W0WB06_HYPEX|nr:hypothetical protein BV898_13385 [Hypsibius exemplaris]
MRKFLTLVTCIVICGLVGGLDADGLGDLNYETRSTTHNSHSEYDVTPGLPTRPVGSLANALFEEVLQRCFEQANPVFHFNEISPENCTSIATDSCGINRGKAFSDKCALNEPLYIVCDEGAGDFEAGYFLQRFGRLNVSRAVILELWGERGVTKEMFQPVADILVGLAVNEFHQIVVQFKFSTIASIEDNAFESLMYLRHITFEHGFDTSSTLSPGLRSHLSLLHCSREYKWLRDWLQLRPYLLAPKNQDVLYRLGGVRSAKHEKGSIFIPVDCATPRFIAESMDGPFSSLMEM